jgi:hypothetical protein
LLRRYVFRSLVLLSRSEVLIIAAVLILAYLLYQSLVIISLPRCTRPNQIQSAWATYDEWKARATSNAATIHATIGAQLRTLAPDQEWIQFAARSPHLLHPDTPLRDPSLITYPLKDDPSVVPVHTGFLERKSRWTRAWTEGYFVLTPAGFLHGYASSDERPNGGNGGAAPTPTFSLFLPQCTLGPYAGPRAGQYKFSVEGRKDGTGTTPAKSGGTLKSLFAPSSGGRAGGAAGEGAAAKSWRCVHTLD